MTKNQLIEAIKSPPEGKGILLLDLDDCLLTGRNIFIIKILPDGTEVKLTPEEYAKRDAVADKENKIKYDYREFRDAKKVANSIITGTPILRNLKIVDSHVNAGWKIGILTARGLESTVYGAVKVWLKFRDTDGVLRDIGNKISRELVHAINDETIVYPGMNDFEKKANVIREYAKKYNQVKFLDDDEKNINQVKEMIKKENIKNVQAIKAWSKS